ncbi:hypothetical protein Rctr197k_049 [Virus Rctr197k]|nr:hypothetical protein Rctr197k_049 [Virus Rctr197k]
MVAALNPYRQIVSGQRAPANAAGTQSRQANLQVVQGQQGLVQRQQRVAQQQRQQPLAGQDQPGAERVLAQARQRVQNIETRPLTRFANQQQEQYWDQHGDFNPQAFGGEKWRDGIQAAIPDPRNRIFDRKGSLNAYDTKDALKQIAYLLQNATREARQARFYREGSEMSPDNRRKVLAAAVQDPEGFAILGQELLLPIKDLVDYEGWARKVYRVRPLAQGEFFRIAKDVRSTAWVIGQDGQGIEARLFGRFVTPSEFKIGSFPTVDISDIYTVNYDILDRAQDTARQEIELEEDKRGRALIDVASQTVNAVTTFGTLGVAAFEDVRFQVERHRLVVEKFLINRAELSDIVKTMSAQVDPVTERELILAGYIGSFLNAMIITSAGTGVEEVVPAGTFYAVTGPEYMGEMGIRVELFSEPFNMFAQQRFVKGWAYGEILGFVIPNPRSCAKGSK